MEKFWNGFVKQANLFDQMKKLPAHMGLADRIKSAPSRVNWSGPSRKVGVTAKGLGMKPSTGGSAPQGAAASQAVKPTAPVTQRPGVPLTTWKKALNTPG